MAAKRAAQQRFDFADIVRAHRKPFESTTAIGHRQRRVLVDISRCRTAALGGHMGVCTACGNEHPFYNSCRNRHCPKCQALAQEKWIEAQRARMLDVPHFHVVFTLPAELRPLAAFARRRIFNMLFRVAASTLAAFARSRLSATVGATLVLHTWTRKLEFHPHIHAIVTGGGLSKDGAKWNAAERAFLFPVKAMSTVFRGKMLSALRHAYHRGHFDAFQDFDDPEGFKRLACSIAKLRWHVYAKPSFEKAKYVLDYLGRYTHRVGIANSRLVSVTDSAVTFRTKAGKTTTVHPVELLGRFVQHVLPHGFHKLRHVGLYASPSLLTTARTRLGSPRQRRRQPISWIERLRLLTGRDLSRCPRCGGPIVMRPLARAPPSETA